MFPVTQALKTLLYYYQHPFYKQKVFINFQYISDISSFNKEEFIYTMSRTLQKAKHSRKSEAVKDIISKLYFSHTQENYLKRYGSNHNYIEELVDLMGKTTPKKLAKIVEQVKVNNRGFCKYLQNKRIVRLTAQDVLAYQKIIESQCKRAFTSNFSFKSDISIKQLDQDIIRIGFMMILQKLTNQKVQTFITETNYLKQILKRQTVNLNQLGYQYMGVDHQDKAKNIMEDLRVIEKENGSFKLISDKIREQTTKLQSVSQYLLKNLIGK